MTYTFVLYLVFVVGINAGTVHLDGAKKEKATEITLHCMKETGVRQELVAEVMKGHLTDEDDENLKKFALCFFQKAGIVSPDGKLNVDVALSKLPAGADKAEAEKLLIECKNTKKGKDAADTTYQVYKCYHDGTKTHILV